MKLSFPVFPSWLSLGSIKPERLFLYLACSFGLLVLFANPPFQAGDECDHYFRAYQLSEGILIGEKQGDTAGGTLPTAIVDVTDTDGIQFRSDKKMTRSLFFRLLHPAFVDWRREQQKFHGFPHTVLYPPVGYLPQLLAIYLGRQLRIGPLGLMYLARLAAFSVSVALGYAALKTLPVYRWTTAILLLCPMSLYLFGSIAPDGMLITAGALLMARLMRLYTQNYRPADLRELAIILILTGFLSLAKLIYFPIAGVALFFALPKLETLRAKALFIAGIFAFCVFPVVAWGRLVATVYVPGRIDIPIDPAAQARHILDNPLAFLLLVVHTIQVTYLNDFRWMIGTLGWGDTQMPAWFYSIYGVGIVGCLVLESEEAKSVGRYPRLVMIVSAAGLFLLIYAAAYASWNSPGSNNIIEGIQGRYFLPLVTLLILSFPVISPHPFRVLVVFLTVTLTVLSASTCLLVLMFRCYVASPPLFQVGRKARLSGVAVRAVAGSGSNNLIVGFVIGGYGRETLLIRSEGPSLTRVGLVGVLAKPTLSVVAANGQILASNSGWEQNAKLTQIADSSLTAGAFVFPAGSADAAVIISLQEGSYTVIVNGQKNATGIATAEIYEVSSNDTRIINVSARSFVGTNEKQMLVNFTIAGNDLEKLLIRADGPSLTQFGIVGVLTNPTLDIGPPDLGGLVNSSWGTSSMKEEIAAAALKVGAFQIQPNSADSAGIVTLNPGSYTAKIYGKGGMTGVALTELYELP